MRPSRAPRPRAVDPYEEVLRDLRAGTDPRWAFWKHGVDPDAIMADPDSAAEVRRAYEVGTGWLVTKATLRGVIDSDQLLARTLAARDKRYADPARAISVGIFAGLTAPDEVGGVHHTFQLEFVSPVAGLPHQLDTDGAPVGGGNDGRLSPTGRSTLDAAPLRSRYDAADRLPAVRLPAGLSEGSYGHRSAVQRAESAPATADPTGAEPATDIERACLDRGAWFPGD